jgi:hypothetical protein
MEVELVNDGPVTLVLDGADLAPGGSGNGAPPDTEGPRL